MYSIDELNPHIQYKTSRSGGSGGQHVNKVSSKVELLFDFEACSLFDEEEKKRIREKMSNRLQTDGYLQVISQENRSQYQNKELAQKKLLTLLQQALKVPKIRKATKKSKASIEKRLEGKRKRAFVKINRRGINLD